MIGLYLGMVGWMFPPKLMMLVEMTFKLPYPVLKQKKETFLDKFPVLILLMFS